MRAGGWTSVRIRLTLLGWAKLRVWIMMGRRGWLDAGRGKLKVSGTTLCGEGLAS